MAENNLPSCFGDYPKEHPQEIAERGCENCMELVGCFAKWATKRNNELMANNPFKDLNFRRFG